MKVVDLFSGCGGMSLGFSSQGFRIVRAYDNWEKAIETYRKNLPNHNPTLLNLLELKNDEHPEVQELKQIAPDVLIGGPPCQDFSAAGKRNGNGKNGNLTPLFAELALKINPTWIVMENVNTIKTIGEDQLTKAKSLLKEGGYGITTVVLNAADFGVPQNRKRFFLIARKNGKDNEMFEHLSRQKKPRISVKDYFSKNSLKLDDLSHYYRHPRKYTRRAIFSTEEVSPTIRGVNRPIPKTYKSHEGDTQKDLAKVRPLTSKERAIIQTFPQNFNFIGNKSEVEQQIGNAVPPVLAAAIASAIKNFEKNSILVYSSNS